MYARFDYAFKKTLGTLEAALKSDKDYVIILAFVISLIGFGSMQFAFEHETNDISATIVSGLATATIFFLSIVGFITLISTMLIFSYNLSIGRDNGHGLSNLSGSNQAWRVVLSFIVTGAVTAAVFNLFSDGLKEISFMRTQYAMFLSDGN